ncbi:endonuclease MutS2 [Kallotenue papyrolyticum]|uniref:endonuclease MutS2 n=1 Tax=Kallotenue papyrolyticum TaxID=1325125 RepID=UPI0004924B1E|nr:endonuclease MutS2 [Kallotenue papyrolyticum]
MPFDTRTLELLEYPKIRERLARHTAFSASRELALSLQPDDDRVVVQRAQQATSAARRLLDQAPDVSIGGARDIRPLIAQAQRGGVLEPTALLEVAATLAAMRQLRRRLLSLPAEDYAPLIELATALPEHPELEAAIERSVDPAGELLDSASPALGRIRAELRTAHNRLLERLNAIIAAPQYAAALQEPIVTMRDGRYVVPIKAGGRRTLPGIVHDQSNSGATLFIEPLQTVELNNRWRELQLAEREEITRILRALTAQIAAAGESISVGVAALAELDLLFAKAHYSLELRAAEPQFVPGSVLEWQEQPALELIRARHPLLDAQRVVPIDVRLGGPFRVLLITGPNTGGKTVALKTTGLLALMAQSGLHIPADARSRLPVFQYIFADIGDEQSIEQSLSTFSSHMTHIIEILRALDAARVEREHGATPANALVLLDELGAGTDPTEGAALARAIIERVLDSGALCIGTTHYAELKAYAYNTPGVENASVAFDAETLQPTYRLEIGLPGRSNALAIAARLGLDAAIVARARSFLSAETERVEDLLAAIAREREAAAAERQAAEQLHAEAATLRARLEQELASLEREREQRLEAFERELEAEMRAIRQELRRLREDTRAVSVTREWLQQAEERLKGLAASTEQRQRQRRASHAAPPATPPRPIQPGDRVHVASVNLEGEVLAVDPEAGEAEVQVGGFRLTAALRDLQRLKGARRAAAPGDTTRSTLPAGGPRRDVSMQFDMRGLRAGEVEALLDRYLNDAYLADLSEVRLIHGKGTGTLRKIVRDVLSNHPLVASYEGGVEGEGGEGVTIARLQTR